LTGKDTDAATSSYVVPATSYIPAPDTLLELNIENPYNSRQVVVYPAGTIPTEKEKAYYQLDANVRALFRFENRTDVDNVLELQQKGFVYVDGAQDGHGDDAHDGTTPERAVKTLKKAYQLLAKEKVGGLISIVGTVTIDQTTSMMNTVTGDTYVAEYKDGSGTVDAGGAVYLRRYAQPTDWKSLSGYDVPSHKGSVLNIVDGGALTLGSVTVDGHSEALTGLPALAAKGVEANAALVEVQTGGTFTCEQYCQLINNNNVAADGKGGALYIHGGTASLKRTNILQVAAKKGSAVYQDGIFNIAFQPKIEGSVYLTGTGTETSPDSSRSIGVLFNGFRPQSGKLDVEVEDPYKGRTIATYPEGGEPSVNERSIYQLSDEINDRYIIGNRTTATNVLELQYRPAVYVDGAVGSDDNTGLAPDTSVKTLKKAYTLLKKMGGGVLYVVDTITLTTETSITGTSYTAGADKIEIIGTPTEIRRYAQPDKWAEYPDFTHASNLNPLIRVAGSTTLQVENLTIDGHKNARTDKGLSPSMIVTGTTQAKGPAILVDIAGNLNLNPGTIIKDNANTATTTALAGGAVGNFGTTVFTDTVLQDNEAVKGAGVYQHGSFTIYGADGLGKQEIYLATNNTGTETDPVWGEGYVIHVQEKLKDTVALNINVDHPVRGRNITVFDTKDAFIDDVSNEIPRFILGNTVPNTLSFVKSETETNTLELQNYDVTYHGNGNTEGIPPVDGHSPYTKGAQVTVLGNMDLTKANAHFLGWNTKADGSGMHYNPLNQFEITENTDLYAMWLKYEKVAEEATPGDNVLRPGEELTYTIKTTMPEAIGNVKIEDCIPENTTYVEGSASGNLTPTFADGKLTWNLGTVHGDQEFNATFKVIVNKDTAEGTDITNTAVVTIAEKDYHTNTTTNTVGKTFSVLYDANGATSGDVPVDTDNYIEGEEPVVQAEGTLARTNAVFFGWNTKADGTGDHYQTNETVKNLKDKVTLYAMWMVAEKNSEEETPGGTLKPGEKLTYTIHVEVPEAKNAVIEDIIPIGTTYVANSANEGGIYDEATNTVTWKLTTTKKTIKDFQFAVTVDVAAVEGVQITNQAKVTIEGQEYTSNEKIDSVGVTYHVIYDGNTNESGTVPIDGAIYEKNEAAIVQGSNDLMKADYVCVGWNTKADGSGDAYVKDNKMTVHADTTLYAMWMKATKISTEGENNNILKPGEELTYTIDVVIPQKTEKLVVVDVIPKGTTYLDGSANENGVYEDGKLTWTLENSEGGSEKQFVFTVIVDRLVTEGTGISNTAEIVIGDNKYHTTTAENKVGKTHTVTYDGSNSDAGQAPIDQRFYAETDYAAVLGNVGAQIARAIGEPMSKKNAVFAGWNTRKDGTGIHYEENDTILMTGDVTLYAMWNQAYKDSMTVDGKPILPGNTMEYKITVKAADNTKQITVLDKIPEGTTYVEGSASNQGVFADNQITWN
ncbi:MAG: InlB B-repeat-containing protein, partial [Lachnospiraceae bacterium]